MTDEELYRRSFCMPSDVSRAEILRTAIANAKKNGYKTTGFWKMRRKQLTGIVNSQDTKKCPPQSAA